MNNLPEKICLCGFMAAGKSKLGYRLAAKFRRRFVDLDDYLVHKHKQSVRDLFQNFGEEVFRSLEREALSELFEMNQPMVISLGGGALQNPHHVDFIKKNSLLVYLNADKALLFKRLSHDTSRPKLLKSDGSRRTPEELKNLITTMLSEREPLYLMADVEFPIKKTEQVELSVENLARTIRAYAH